jgi:hypothetical protein
MRETLHNEALYASEPMIIGKHSWRMKIIRRQNGQTTTRYEFMDESGCFWHDQKDWPRYNFNDTYLGLPRGLNKLYEREQVALTKYNLTPPVAMVRQMSFRL